MLTRFLADHKLPGVAVAIARNGELVYARGFGQADRERHEAMHAGALFRIASLSKPITAAAVLHLVDQGKLKLTDHVFDVVAEKPHLERSGRVDPRLQRVTVLECLQHTGGWDRDKSFDPMSGPSAPNIARSLGVKMPLHPHDIVRYMWGRPLDFNPGTRSAYSNFGYCVLGRVIEKAGGESYERYVQRHVLQPLGIREMRLGHSLAAQRAPGEVSYYHLGRPSTMPAVTGPVGQTVPYPYGGFNIEAMDSHGGWLASAADLVKFACAFDHADRCPVLTRGSVERLFAPPPGLVGHDRIGRPLERYYACGWDVVAVPGGHNTWHTGMLEGNTGLLVRRADGLCWAVLFNASRGSGNQPCDDIDPLMHQTADGIKTWPAPGRVEHQRTLPVRPASGR
jgi:N-acyl-D-amino-acid deacylase